MKPQTPTPVPDRRTNAPDAGTAVPLAGPRRPGTRAVAQYTWRHSELIYVIRAKGKSQAHARPRSARLGFSPEPEKSGSAHQLELLLSCLTLTLSSNVKEALISPLNVVYCYVNDESLVVVKR